jgi:hypothetical protein
MNQEYEEEVAQQRADAENIRVEVESLRAETEKLRAERLAARLRELGKHPDIAILSHLRLRLRSVHAG